MRQREVIITREEGVRVRLVVGKVEARLIKMLSEKNGIYPSIIALAKDYVARYGYGFYTRQWLRVFTARLYKMQEKGLIKIISEPGKPGKSIVLQPLGWAYIVKTMKGGGVEGKDK
jgi:hypothetical protein